MSQQPVTSPGQIPGSLQWLLQAGEIPSPCFVLDAPRLRANAAILDQVQKATGARILMALKAFAAFAVFPLLSRQFQGPLWGVCASSADEARLGREFFGGEVHAFAAAWSGDEIRELLPQIDHLVFNSLEQWQGLGPEVGRYMARTGKKLSCGLRINPEHSEVTVPLYDPCSPGSRLGIRAARLRASDPDARIVGPARTPGSTAIDGLHFHSLCELGAEPLARTLAAVESGFAPWLAHCQWINMGGGHHITKPGYNVDLLQACLTSWRDKWQAQIYLEPGEAVALNAGWLVATVLDIVEADMPVAILDISAACHTPDVIEMPYRPDVFVLEGRQVEKAGEAENRGNGMVMRLAGKSCLAGDVIGEYSFASRLMPGQRLVFADMAIYSMVKTTTFNGLRLPSIGICDQADAGMEFRLLRKFGYEDFKNRLS